jgi:hypothetical protein
VNDCVATAPTPASTRGTHAPTPNPARLDRHDEIPVASSRVTIKYVIETSAASCGR